MISLAGQGQDGSEKEKKGNEEDRCTHDSHTPTINNNNNDNNTHNHTYYYYYYYYY